MEFENTFVVDAPMEEVWDLLLDVERIAPCMPGAQVLEQTGDDAYKVAVKVKLGPMTMNYKGDVEIVEKDARPTRRRCARRPRRRAARERRRRTCRMALREQDGGTEASILTEMQMSGKAAAMGQGVIKDVAATLTDTFAQNLAALMEPPRQRSPTRPAPHAAAPSARCGAGPGDVAARRQDRRVGRAGGPRPSNTLVFAVLVLLVGIAIGRRRR